jgi:hypothetical protein
MRHKETPLYLCLYQADNSAAKHSIEECYINFVHTREVAGTTGYMDQIVKQATEIQLHPKNFNRGMGFNWSQSWNPSTSILWQRRTIEQQLKAGLSTACSLDILVEQL